MRATGGHTVEIVQHGNPHFWVAGSVEIEVCAQRALRLKGATEAPRCTGLGSGEARILRPGDVFINRCAMRKWRNVSSEKPARILFVMLDVKPIIVNGKTLEFDVGDLTKE
ncbi:hypothetical protein CTA2_1298 [Colletotrichum tanaceti]|uniref:Uncharacterized protein n=1 Tax=Colletotrichum tanaceti TaxID=1306861 RepID=A0A4U6X110_9PEZI|nr:hypothetical protein CTA2_1298 [Colletotrichum tanaceti]TKW49058.1 hypothetical protein CTA1_10166 [Colletotrichum tanaceti]